MSKILVANNYLHCEDFSGSIKIDTEKNQMSIFNIKLQSSIQTEKTKVVSIKEKIQEPFLEDYCDDIPEISREIEVYSGDEEVKRIPAGPAIPRVLKPLQKAVLSRKEVST